MELRVGLADKGMDHLEVQTVNLTQMRNTSKAKAEQQLSEV